MRVTTIRKLFPALVFLLMGLTCFAQVEKKEKSPPPTEKKESKKQAEDYARRHAQLAAIEKYCKEVDAYKKEKGVVRKTFATIDAGKKGTRKVWMEFKSDKAREQADTGENLNENAFVWLRKNKVVAATFTFQDTSRKWVHFAFYYFRADGSLAKLDEELDRDKIKFVRKSYFAEDRKQVAGASNYFNNASQPISPPKNFADRKAPVYKSVTDLPFFAQLNAEAAPRKKN